MELKPCSIGAFQNDDCHKVNFTRIMDLQNISELTSENQELLLWRSGSPESCETVCAHHKVVYLTRYQTIQHLTCCNPFHHHKKTVKGGLRIVSLDFAKKIKTKLPNLPSSVIPGQKLCTRCRTDIYNELKKVETSREHEGSSKSPKTDRDSEECCEIKSVHASTSKEKDRDELNMSLCELGVSPLKLHSIPLHSRAALGKRKIKQAKSHLKSKVSRVLDLPHLNESAGSENLTSDTDEESSKNIKVLQNKANDLDKLVLLLKKKLSTVKRSRKIQLLTLTPASWTNTYAAKEFNVSTYMVKQARKLAQKKGICEMPNPQKGKKIPETTVELVRKFYQDDQYSRLMPGKKDCISLGKNVYEQKRLILCNLDELYAVFKEVYPDVKVGFSKFCYLRPKWCVIAGSSGTHAICVCVIHQNPELLVQALDIDKSVHDLMALMVCNRSNRNCSLGQCETCPGEAELRTYFQKHFETLEESDSDDYLDETIQFYQWVTTDRASLIIRNLQMDEFLDLLVNQLQQLIPHSFITTAQSTYLKQRKEHLPSDTALVLMDFAENYSFVVQDEVQSFHWSHSSCTLHPVVVYHRPSSEVLQNFSICYLSDDLDHDVSFVHQVQKLTSDIIKTKYPAVTKIEYFTDGCAAQYKNCKNMLNLCHHERDFGLSASWSFFATSHGKSPCDGVGGSVKRMTTKASLQRPFTNQILSVTDMLEFCTNQFSKIIFKFIDKQSMIQVRNTLSERFKHATTITGTRSFHHFFPVSETTISTKKISADDSVALTFQFTGKQYSIVDQLKIKCFVCCNYDMNWYVGEVEEISISEGDARVNFMHPKGPARSFHWPTPKDNRCWIPFPHILCVINMPTTETGRQYQLSEQCQQLIGKEWLKFTTKL